jgi:hypothetical protein
MNIRIDSLSVNGLGPISTIKWPLKAVNLIYGKNEQGKTFLVEYLLKSLFRKAPGTRTLTDSGQVIVSGLGDEIVTFTPKSRKKVDDYVFSSEEVNSVDLSRLCVVKGGDTSFLPYSKESISKDVLKEYLSDQRTLDAIEKGIPSTTRESLWENGQIISKRNMGPIRDWNEACRRLTDIDDRLSELDESFTLGEVKKLKSELANVSKTVEDQLQARRAYAYTLAEKIKEIEIALMRIPYEKLEEAKSLNIKLVNKINDIERSQLEIDTLEPECAHFDWLKTALEECEKRPVASGNKRGSLFMIITIIGIVITTLSALAGLPSVALVTGLLSILFLVLTVNQYRTRLKNISDDMEVARKKKLLLIILSTKYNAISIP